MWYGDSGPYMMGHYGGWWPMAIHGIFAVVVWALVIAALVLAVRWLWYHGSGARRGRGGSDARSVLDERFARGEIDREEYLARRRDLS